MTDQCQASDDIPDKQCLPDKTGPDITGHNNTGQDRTGPGKKTAGVFQTRDSGKVGKKKPSDFDEITESMLRNKPQLLNWFKSVSSKPDPVIAPSEANQIGVLAEASHVLRLRVPEDCKNRVAVFVSNVSAQRWHFSSEDEDAARKAGREQERGPTSTGFRPRGVKTNSDLQNEIEKLRQEALASLGEKV